LIRRIIVFLLVIASFVTIQAQDDDQPNSPFFDGENAFIHVENHVAVGPRPMATVGNIEAGNIILSHLDTLGWETSEDWHLIGFGDSTDLTPEAQQTFDLWQPLTMGGLLTDYLEAENQTVEFNRLLVPVRNLVASYGEGSTIIIGAHYDSRIFSDKDVDPTKRLLPMPGANDGGSGVGVLLELARVISENYIPNHEIRLVFFDAEDNGRIAPFADLIPQTSGYLIGSTLYANRLDLETENIDYMLLVDLVGEFDQAFPIEGYSNQSAPDIAAAIWETARTLGYEAQFPNEVGGSITDDHVPFIQRGIPAVDIIDLDYAYWDTSEDTIDKISVDSLARVGEVLEMYLLNSGAITLKTAP